MNNWHIIFRQLSYVNLVYVDAHNPALKVFRLESPNSGMTILSLYLFDLFILIFRVVVSFVVVLVSQMLIIVKNVFNVKKM